MRLVGDAGVADAVGAVLVDALAAEGEAIGAGIADRPLAHVGAEGQHGRRTRLFVIDDRPGLSPNRKLGLAAARAKVFFFCGPDEAGAAAAAARIAAMLEGPGARGEGP